MALAIEEKLLACKNCGKATIHHRNSNQMGVIVIIINIFLVLITSGLWLIPLILFLVAKSIGKSVFYCRECGMKKSS